MRKILTNIALLALIAYVGRYYIAPTIMCWREGGSWSYTKSVCHMGTYDVTGNDLMPNLEDKIPKSIDLSTLRELPLRIPNGEDTSATLMRTDDAFSRFVASFPQGVGVTPGVAEARVEYAVSDAESGFTLIPFFVNYGGTGSFEYIGLYKSGSTSVEHIDSVLIGDRVVIDDVFFERSGSSITAVVYYKDRAPLDAMTTVPHVSKRLVTPVTQGYFGEPAIYDLAVDFTATYKDLLKLEAPAPGVSIQTPLTVRGVARGQWFFEASFPINIRNEQGAVIGEGHAEAIGDWMTTEYVPFSATVTFTPQTKDSKGTVVLMKDNPSGLPEHDDSFSIPITF